MLQEGGVVHVVLRALGVVENRHHAKPEIKFLLWERPCICLGARNLDDCGSHCASKQIRIHVHIPPKQIHAAADHARMMSGLVAAVVGGGGAGGQGMPEANE